MHRLKFTTTQGCVIASKPDVQTVYELVLKHFELYVCPLSFRLSSVEYNCERSETDPKAIFQQQIRKSRSLSGTAGHHQRDCHSVEEENGS